MNMHLKAEQSPPKMVSLLEPSPPLDPTAEAMIFLRDSSLGVALPGAIGGYVMGAGINIFGAALSVESASQNMGVADFFKSTFSNAHKVGKNFGFFAVVFGVMDHAFEKRRGRKDMWNPIYSGAILGGFYGYRSYHRPGLVAGMAGGALFSWVTELLMAKMGMSEK